MRSFLTNPWVVGIIGGILSGLLVTWITRKIFYKKDNKEYLQKILQANKEVIYAIRPTISEEEIPSKDIIDSLISSNSIKYGIEIRDMYSIKEICNELIKEVMDSSFISSKTKKEHCEKLLVLRNMGVKENPEISNEERKESKKEALLYKEKLMANTALILGMMATIMTFVLTIFTSLDSGVLFDIFYKDLDILAPTIFITFITIVVAILVLIYSDILKRLKSKTKNKEMNNENEEK